MTRLIKLRYLLGIMIALMFSAIFGMSYFYDGSSISKYFCNQAELERVSETKIAAYSDQLLYGDALESVPDDFDPDEIASPEEGYITTDRIRQIDDNVILILMIASWLMLLPVLNSRRYFSFIYLFLGAYVVSLSVFKVINGGSMFSELAVPAHASRWFPCLIMWIWLFFDIKANRISFKVIIYLLISAASLTFAIHGYEAFNEHSKFKDLMYGTLASVAIPLNEPICVILLKMVGIKDIFLAIAVILFINKWRWILLWMTFWGIFTALTRPIAGGDTSWLEALLRIGNGMIPLLIYLLFKYLDSENIRTNQNNEII